MSWFTGGDRFEDRRAAGRALAAALGSKVGPEALILALPRGGVPVAFEAATALGAELDLLLVRKIGAPGHEELAIGAVVDGSPPRAIMNERSMEAVRPSDAHVESERKRQIRELERRRAAYRGDRPPVEMRGRTVVIVDDGIATGSTARVALEAARAAGAARVVLAVPVAPPDTLEALKPLTDEIVCLSSPEPFYAVGAHYRDFDQTSDEEVVSLLEEARRLSRGGAGPSPD